MLGNAESVLFRLSGAANNQRFRGNDLHHVDDYRRRAVRRRHAEAQRSIHVPGKSQNFLQIDKIDVFNYIINYMFIRSSVIC